MNNQEPVASRRTPVESGATDGKEATGWPNSESRYSVEASRD